LVQAYKEMKFNWGTGIVIAIVLFISYIMFMVITMISTHTDVVEDDYYAQQIDYQATKEAKERGLEVFNELEIEITEESLNIILPQKVVSDSLSGSALFYRPENASLDKIFKFNAEMGNNQKIPLNQLTSGSYLVKINWNSMGESYLVEKHVSID